MNESNIYIHLWEKYRPIILTVMKRSVNGYSEYPLSVYEFKAIGERMKSGHAFNLQIEKGVIVNNIDGSAVARDLVAVLKSSKTAMELMRNNNFKINLSKQFMLKIQTY